jgi:peptidoglycan hydrolase-like protein with peptidoglycan-binding domain
MVTYFCRFLPLLLLIFPAVTGAYVDCRDTVTGCSVDQLIEISTQTHLTTDDRRSALFQALEKLQTQLRGLGTATQSTTSTPATTTATCLDLRRNLYIGTTDATTDGEVSKLQAFLVAAGVYPEGNITGYYGNATAQAVMRLQNQYGMNFVTLKSGVGPMTRAKLRCGTPSSVTAVRFNVAKAYPNIANDYPNDPRKHEQTVKATVVFANNGTREYDLGTAHGCAASSTPRVVGEKRVLGTVDCYFALQGTTFTAYELGGKFAIERFDDDASGRTPGKLTVLVRE